MATALRDAIDRARRTERTGRPVLSPLRALGRHQLSPIDLIGQSLSTIAPATGMVYIALWMVTRRPGVAGLVTIAATTAVVGLVAFCISQFTRRCAAAGSLYSFVFQGLGPRTTLTAGATLLLCYLGISVSVLIQAGGTLLDIAGLLGHGVDGYGAWLAAIVLVAAAGMVITVRGVRFATRAILITETCSLLLVVAIMVGTPGATASASVSVPEAPLSLMPFLAMVTVLSMAGFESAAFFGPEAKRPLVTVTRTVLVAPVIVGLLFVFAAGAALLGRGSVIVDAYFGGVDAGVAWGVVLAVKIGIACSWFACTVGCAQAGSRLLYSMGVERVLPHALSRVHVRFRTPYVAVGVFTVVGLCGSALHGAFLGVDSGTFDAVVEVALVVAYTLVALASWRFLARIGELTMATRLAAITVATIGAGLLVAITVDAVLHRLWVAPATVLFTACAGTVWYAVLHRLRPASLATLGVFDTVETTDILPGAGVLVLGDDGRHRIVADRATRWPRESA
ncbi:APC family permease [Nocardioides houyundeii]|uniref:APC family permease n=1 Tax=Nocardioides houyundeii TaxID=2045452 RepID=UPI0018EF5F3C|nr:APC family permease [Nocardioides houyundeii]